MHYLDRLVLQELATHRDPEVRKKASELLKLLLTGKTPEVFMTEREMPLIPRSPYAPPDS